MKIKELFIRKARQAAKRFALIRIFSVYFEHISSGYRLYEHMKKTYGEDVAIMMCPFNGTGDIYAIGLYLEEFITKKNISKFIFAFRGKAEQRVAALFPVFSRAVKQFIIDSEAISELQFFCDFMGNCVDDLFIIHHCAMNRQLIVTSGIEGFRDISMVDMYKRVCFDLPENAKKAVPQFNSLNQEIVEEFRKKSLIPGKTVILSPYSTCIKPLPDWFWEDIANQLKQCGYTVCTNSAGQQEPVIKGTVPIFFTYSNAASVLEYAGYFIAIRSGLCDIVSSAKCKKIVLYPRNVFFCPPDRTIGYVGLKNMGLCEDYEIVFDNNYPGLELQLLKAMEEEGMDILNSEKTDKAAVTVIISAYNSEKTLRRTLDSATRQGLDENELEILVIDNGSTDGTADVLKEFKKTKWASLKIISIEKNIGVSAARNRGIQNAIGEYLTFCDSDDEIIDGSYAEMYFLAKNKDADVVVGNYYDVWSDGTIVLNEFNHSESMFSEVFFGGTVWCKLYKNDFIKKNRICFPDTNHMEDNVFLGYVSLYIQKLATYKKPMYRYMRGFADTNALSKNASIESFSDSVKSVKMLYSLPLKCSDAERASCIQGALKYLNRLFVEILDYNDRKTAFALLQDIVRKNDWSIRKESFNEVFPLIRDEAEFLQINYDLFEILNGLRYNQNTTETKRYTLHASKDAVLKDFREGQIGFRYIWLYIKAWLAFKLKGSKSK